MPTRKWPRKDAGLLGSSHIMPSQDTEDTFFELSEEETFAILSSGEIIDVHLVPQGSNYSFLVRIDSGSGRHLRAIYKPRDGERPLHDFPEGTLYRREYAAFMLSRALGWPNVPPTLIRYGPLGLGSFQLFIDSDSTVTYFDLISHRAEDLHRIAVFDLLANNADRKASHCLPGKDGQVWSIDHGLTFHTKFKLRTAMIDFWGQPIAPHLLPDLNSLLAQLAPTNELTKQLAEAITPQEIKALIERLHLALDNPFIPILDPYLNVPWPWT